jgi:hypothetical protein
MNCEEGWNGISRIPIRNYSRTENENTVSFIVPCSEVKVGIVNALAREGTITITYRLSPYFRTV